MAGVGLHLPLGSLPAPKGTGMSGAVIFAPKSTIG